MTSSSESYAVQLSSHLADDARLAAQRGEEVSDDGALWEELREAGYDNRESRRGPFKEINERDRGNVETLGRSFGFFFL